MKPRFWETNKFKNLETKFNNKLKDSGFKDIEKDYNGIRRIKSRADRVTRQPINIVAAKIQYFDTLSMKTFTHRFKPDQNVEELILSMRAEGKSILDIVKELKNKEIQRHRTTVTFIIRRFEHMWGIRTWTLKQRNLKISPAIK